MSGTASPAAFTPNVFLSIDASGLVSVIAHRSEMGQGIRTSAAMVVADELEADWARVRIVQAEGDEKNTAIRTPTGRTASAAPSNRCARRAPRPA